MEPRTPVGAGGWAVWARLGGFTAVLAAGVLVAVVVGFPDPARLRADLAGAGAAAPALFVLIYAGATLAPLPKNVLSALAGLLFGLPVGVLVVFVAAMIGAVAAFGLGRVLGRAAVERITGARVARLDALLRRRGVLAVVGVRLVPVLPFTAINYAAGLTAVRTRDYVLGTAIGIVPGTVAYVTLGSSAMSPGSWPFVVAVVVLVGLSVGGAVAARRRTGARRGTRRSAWRARRRG